MKIIAMLLAVITISAATPALAQQVEPVYGISTDAKEKTMTVVFDSTGCSDKSYFSFGFENDLLTFKRVKRDACKAMPMRHPVTYSLKELGVDPQKPFRLGNPISYSQHLF